MKKHIYQCFSLVILLLNLTGCGLAAPESFLATDSKTDANKPKTISTKSVQNPQDITAFSLSDDSLYEGKPFQYQNQEYQIKEYRIKRDAEEDDLVPYWTLHQVHSQEPADAKNPTNSPEPIQNHKQGIPLIDPQEIPHIDTLEKQEFFTRYILNNVFFISGYLFYSYQEYTVNLLGINGTEIDWGKAMLCRMNLKSMEIDHTYILITKEQEKTGHSFLIQGAEPDSGYIYFSRNGKLFVLNLSLEELDMKEFDSSEYILDIYWGKNGYIFTDIGIYRMNLALNSNKQLESPEIICTWPSELNDGYAEAIGIYGRFLYGYTYYHGNNGAGIAGHYFQIDLDGNCCNIVSADQKKSFLGEYHAEISFDTESFADKHELYSEGWDSSDDSWDPIQICYVLSEDGSVEIKTEKITQ
ncbi:MAG: hypothetical protein K2J67_10160 [Lachnospiraceae bacterium]|nr:hypothetical protein [Lachnospiraceae bacterium]